MAQGSGHRVLTPGQPVEITSADCTTLSIQNRRHDTLLILAKATGTLPLPPDFASGYELMPYESATIVMAEAFRGQTPVPVRLFALGTNSGGLVVFQQE